MGSWVEVGDCSVDVCLVVDSPGVSEEAVEGAMVVVNV